MKNRHLRSSSDVIAQLLIINQPILLLLLLTVVRIINVDSQLIIYSLTCPSPRMQKDAYIHRLLIQSAVCRLFFTFSIVFQDIILLVPYCIGKQSACVPGCVLCCNCFRQTQGVGTQGVRKKSHKSGSSLTCHNSHRLPSIREKLLPSHSICGTSTSITDTRVLTPPPFPLPLYLY